MATKEKQNIITERTTLPQGYGYVLTYKRHSMTDITPVWSESSWPFS